MENKIQEAYVQLSPREGYIGPKDQKPNVETFYHEGVRYDVAIGKLVKVPLGLAIEMKRGGKISSYAPVE